MTIFRLRPENFGPETIRAIPAGVTILVISPLSRDSTPLFVYTGEQLSIGFAAIPASVTTLDLSSNDLTHLYENLAIAFAAIPLTVKTLIFAGNGVCNFRTGGDVRVFLRAIPTGVATLDLSNNHLCDEWTPLAIILTATPIIVTTLNLSLNNLGKKTTAELIQDFAAVPLGVIRLDLSDNNLNSKTAAELFQIFAAIPNTVKKVIIDDVSRAVLENCGLYLNFRAGEFVRHSDLDKAQMRKHASGFCSTVANGRAQEPLITAFSKYLTTYDLANLRLVCKDAKSTQSIEGSKNDTYCGFKSGFLLNRKNGLFN